MAQKMELTEWAKPAWRDPSYGNYAMGYGRAREFDWEVIATSLLGYYCELGASN